MSTQDKRPEPTTSHYEPRPNHREQVEAMAGYGLPEAGIAKVLAIDLDTLRLHYAAELGTGQLKANARVAESLYRKAIGDGPQSVTAAIFWLKTRAHWKEAMISEVTHNVADPIAELLQRIAEHGRPIHGQA